MMNWLVSLKKIELKNFYTQNITFLCLLCYFDLDNFKAFNDVYGFKNGDRVIQLFTDILRKTCLMSSLKLILAGMTFLPL